ncbi:MAG: YHYH protein [Flavobacteriales bacterium]|nr:YHYH protein [Flavobacteriales bacterium]
MKKNLLPLLGFASLTVMAQEADLDSWMLNTTDYTASYYNTMGSLVGTSTLADIQGICYDNDSVWIKSAGLSTGMSAWSDPGAGSDQEHVFRIPRDPVVPSVKVAVPTTYNVGVLVNIIPIFGMGDDLSYSAKDDDNGNMGDVVWNGEAYYSEGSTLNEMGAHPNQEGVLHTHALATPLWENTPIDQHSPIIGWVFDGFPIYGPYGYADPLDPMSTIEKINSGYQLRTMTDRLTLPDDSESNPPGPDDFSKFPLGAYIEDYEWVDGLGDLDEYNGRFMIAPEYPNGTYA